MKPTCNPAIMKTICYLFALSILLTACGKSPADQKNPLEKAARSKKKSIESEAKGLADPFIGITTDGEIEQDLFPVQATGVSTEPVRLAATAFLESLDEEQRKKTRFSIDDDEWRKWMNQHFYIRQGVGFDEMSAQQREAAFALMGASLSAKGLQLSKDIMKLNHTLGEINDNFVEYGEWLYWITIMGEPSATEPWGWQMDGHHLIINYFVLGDQVVMTPLFVGSEPVIAETGKYKGISILQDEQNMGLDMLQSLTEQQQQAAIIEVSKTGNNNLTEAFKDNVILDYAGVQASSFTEDQQAQFLSLIQLYVDNMDEGHSKVKMEEVAQHLDDTWFSWIGGSEENSVYYYRIHSPVILIEFDQQKPVGTRQLYGKEPHRQHIHAVVRTPNGNDYGKDLLRQHHADHKH